MKTLSIAFAAALTAFLAFGEPQTVKWVHPVQNGHRCEFCEKYDRALKVLKGTHLRECRNIIRRHKAICPFARKIGMK